MSGAELRKLLVDSANLTKSVEVATAKVTAMPPPVDTWTATDAVINTTGFERDKFGWAVGAVNLIFQETGVNADAATTWKFFEQREESPPMEFDELKEIVESPMFLKAIYLRGVRPKTMGLDERQLLLINELTNSASSASIATRLRRVGVSELEYQTWLGHGPFKRTLIAASEKALSNAQAGVNMALTTKALSGSLDAIKYFNQLTGRYDPASQNQVDVRAYTLSIIDVLTRNITDQELLQRIATELQMVANAHSMNPQGAI